MFLTKRFAAASVVCAGVLQSAVAGSAAELADLAARIEYGFYSEEPRVIDAARNALERLGERDSAVEYHRALAALRLAQLGARTSAPTGALVGDCIERAGTGDASAEAWILVAACATLGARSESMKALLHQRRRDQALARARSMDPDNPRIALLEAWAVSLRPALEEPAVRDQAAARLEHAVEAFESWTAPVDGPDWGEAEARAQLGEIYLLRGETRAARDLIERALLIAPDYQFAVRLRGQLHGAR